MSDDLDELTKAEQRGYANAMEAERKLHEDHIEQLEAKLAKAVEALHIINVLDPEEQVSGCSPDALRGLVNLMGSNARTVLAELEAKDDQPS